MEPNWIQCTIEKSNWVQCYWMEPKWINVLLIGIPLQVLCYWKESYWIQYYVDCNTTEHDVNVWNLWELNVIFREIPLSLLLWMAFILKGIHYNPRKLNVFIAILNGITVNSMLVNGIPVILMWYWLGSLWI